MEAKLQQSTRQRLVDILFVIMVFIVTRQVPFTFLSPVMNLSVISILVLGLSQVKLDRYVYALVFTLLLLPLLSNLIYAVTLTDNNIVIALKFFVVLLSVGLAYFVSVSRDALKWFLRLCLLQALILMLIHLYLSLFMNIKTYLPIRLFFLDQGWGDVYTYNGFFYRVQIKGNALLVVAFILNFEIPLFKRQYLAGLFLLVGIIIAGNFAFLIALLIYFLYKVLSLKGVGTTNMYLLRILCLAVFSAIALPFVFQYVNNVIAMKDNSLGTRWDQVDELMKNLKENPFTFLLGQGLGNTLEVRTRFRDYTGDTYFELQAVYFFNQLGLISSLLFLIYNVLIAFKNWGLKQLNLYFIYIIYISYAITNPYILDTNHVILIIVLNSMRLILKEGNENRENCSSAGALPTRLGLAP